MENSPDYLYVDKDNLFDYELFQRGTDDKGNYIILGNPILRNDGNYLFPIKYLNYITPKDYENPNFLIRRSIQFYIKDKVEFIGGGLYGKVYKSGIYAIKTFDSGISYDSPYLDSSYLRETATLLRLNHPNIISLIDIVEGSPAENLLTPKVKKLSIILPLATMSLNDYIIKYNHDDNTKKYITYQIIKGFNYLQNKDIIHGDIKPDNVLLFVKDNGTFDVKISDFGLSTHTSCKPSNLMNQAYNNYYRPIEIILSIGYGLPADIWALACMIYTIYTTKYLFHHSNDDIELDYIKTLKEPAKQKALYDFNKKLPLDVLGRMVKILGDPLREWPELKELLRNKTEYTLLFKQGEYHPELIKLTLNNDEIYGVILKMLRYNPLDRIKLNELVIDKYFSNIPGYTSSLDQIICDDIIDKRQKYPSSFSGPSGPFGVRNECFDYIREKMKKYQFDITDYFMICYIFDTCYTNTIKEGYINFTIACISIWSCFKYGEAKGIPLIVQYKQLSQNQILALNKISEYCRMIVNILSNDLTVSTIGDYIRTTDDQKFIDLLVDSMKTDVSFKNLPKDIFFALDMYFYERNYIDIINNVVSQLNSSKNE